MVCNECTGVLYAIPHNVYLLSVGSLSNCLYHLPHYWAKLGLVVQWTIAKTSNSQTSRFCGVSRFRFSTRVPETGPQNPVVSAVSARNEKRLRSRFSTRFSFLFLHLSYRPYMPLVCKILDFLPCESLSYAVPTSTTSSVFEVHKLAYCKKDLYS